MIAPVNAPAACRTRPDAVLVILLAGQFMANLDTAIVNLALPSIGVTLGASAAELQLVAAAYVLASAMLLVTAARLGTMTGRRRIFLAGLAVFTAASLLCGCAPSVAWLIAGRAVQGAGAALMVAQVLGGIHARSTGRQRARALGAYTLTLSVSAVLGQLLGGALLTANIGGGAWRPLFLINVPLGIVLLAGAARAFPRDEPARSHARLDTGGVALLAATMLGGILPLTLGREAGWPPWAWIALGASTVTAAAFVARERRLTASGGGPLVDARLFAIPGVPLDMLASSLTRFTYFGLLFVVALFVQDGRGRSAFTAALTLVAWVAAYGAAGPVFGRLPARIGRHGAVLGCSAMGGAYAALAVLAASGALDEPRMMGALAVGGFGFGVASTSLAVRLTNAVPVALAPDFSGVMSTLVPLSAVIGVAAFGSLYASFATSGGAENATRAFALTCALFSACATGAALAAAARVGSPVPG